MKVVLSGYFGFGNIGDEAILEAMVRELRVRDANIDITVLSVDPESTGKNYSVKAVQRWSIKHIIKAIKGSDILISGGGGLLQDRTGPFTLIYYLGLIFIAKFYKKKVAILGQGFGPIDRLINKLLARWILNKVDLIVVRDEESLQKLAEFKINKPKKYLAADVTLTFEKTSQEKKSELLKIEGIAKGDSPLIGFSIRKPSGKISRERRENFYKAIATTADYLIEKLNAKIVFIPFHYPKDVIESAKIINLMRNPVHIVVREYKANDLMAIIGCMDLFIGMRLHSLIFSAIEGVPMLGISYDPKVLAFLNSINQKCISLEELKESDKLTNLTLEIFQNKNIIKEKLKQEIPSLKSKASLNFDIFFKFFEREKVLTILDVKIDNLTIEEAIKEIDLFVRSRKPHLVVTPNPEMVVMAQKDKDLKEILNSAHLNLPDGVGLLWASKVFGKPIKERVSGIDLIPKIAELSQRQGYKIYLLGSKPGIAAGAHRYLIGKYPNLKIVGTHHGFFNREEEVKVIENLAIAEPDILIVGMGSPKQEKWLAENLKVLNIPVSIAVGGSLDVLAGKVKRAPKIFQRLALEWFWRLITQPWRIVRQLRLLKFVWLVLRSKKS